MKLTGLLSSLDVAIPDPKRVYGLINDNFNTLKKSLQNRLSFRDNLYCDIVTGSFNSGAPRVCKLTNLSRAAGGIVVGSSMPCMAAPLVVSGEGYAMVTLFFAGMATNVTATVILVEEGSAPRNPQTILADVNRPGIISPDGTTITITPAGVISSGGGPSSYCSAGANTAAGQSIPSGTSPIVIFGTVEKDTDSAYSIVTGRYTIPLGKGGDYSVVGQLTYAAAFTGTAATIVAKNGTQIKASETINPTANSTVACATTLLGLVAGDIIDVRAFQSSGGASALSTNATLNYFTIHRILGS